MRDDRKALKSTGKLVNPTSLRDKHFFSLLFPNRESVREKNWRSITEIIFPVFLRPNRV